MTAKHTPGPWSRNIKPASRYPTIWAGRNTHVAAVVPGAPWGSGNGANMAEDELEANINLIAAAPDLLDALEDLVKAHRAARVELGYDDDGESDSIELAEAAIAKAKGS